MNDKFIRNKYDKEKQNRKPDRREEILKKKETYSEEEEYSGREEKYSKLKILNH